MGVTPGATKRRLSTLERATSTTTLADAPTECKVMSRCVTSTENNIQMLASPGATERTTSTADSASSPHLKTTEQIRISRMLKASLSILKLTPRFLKTTSTKRREIG